MDSPSNATRRRQQCAVLPPYPRCATHCSALDSPQCRLLYFGFRDYQDARHSGLFEVTMLPSLPFMGESLLAAPALALYLLPPGFVVGSVANVAGFRGRSAGEKLMWSLVLSIPIATMIAVLGGRFAGPHAVNAIFLIVAGASGWIGLGLARKGRLAPPGYDRRGGRRLLIALAAAAALLLVTTAAIEIGGRLYEGVVINDWYIRLPVQWAAARSGVPPFNPLFTLDGVNPPMRYYYFFYVLCAAPMRLFHLDSRGVMTASTLWACAAFFAICWLMLKYLVLPFASREGRGIEDQRPRWNARSSALVLFVLSLASGLEVLPNLLVVVLGMRPFASLQWWTAEGLSAWPSLLLFIPHHYAGLVCGLAGYLLLTLSREHDQGARWATVLLAGVCFAAAIGTSTFIAFTILAATGVLGVIAALRRHWGAAAEATTALVVAVVLDAFYIRETFLSHVPVASTASGTASKFPIGVVLRYWHTAYGMTDMLLLRFFHCTIPHGPLKYASVLPALLAYYAIEFGFLWFVLAGRLRLDWGRSTPEQTRSLWVLLGTGLVISCFLSSAGMQHGLNDLGRLASLVPRTVLLLWAVPMAIDAWQRWRSGTSPHGARRLLLWGAVACLGVGWCGEALNVVWERVYIPLGEARVFRLRDPFSYAVGGPRRFQELFEAWAAIDRSTPPDAIVQDNPDGLLQRPLLLYLNRRVAAGDVECETSFGGDAGECIAENTLPLMALYAQPDWRTYLQAAPSTGISSFISTCRALRLSALIVTDSDPVWKIANSWVWQQPTLYSGESVRVLPCPL
jgi:hypothetical protein